MICYKDMTFCSFWKECKKGKKCDRALTEEVKRKADRWFGKKGAPISEFMEKPECFKEKKK